MERKVLLAVDGSPHSLRSVRYVGRTFGPLLGFGMDLVHFRRPAPPILVEEARTDPASLARLKQHEAESLHHGQEVLARAMEELRRLGVARERIGTRLPQVAAGLAKELVFLAEQTPYDALVVGRRGLGLVQELFLGSVSSQCLELARSVPVWVVDGEVVKPHVLVAVDGSEGSRRAVDHAGFILARHPELRATLIHVAADPAACAPDQAPAPAEAAPMEERRCLEELFRPALALLLEAGVARERVGFIFKSRERDLAQAIVGAARRGGFGTIVVGRRGLSRLKGLLLGSVSRKIVQAGQNLAVWVVP